MRKFKFILMVVSTLTISIPALANVTDKEVGDLSPNELAALEYAYGKMIKRNKQDPNKHVKDYKNSVEFRKSLAFWSNSHNIIKRNITDVSAVAGGLERCRKLVKVGESNSSPLPDCEKFLNFALNNLTTKGELSYSVGSTKYCEMWGTCPHGVPEFLLWHRLYLGTFEKALLSNLKDSKKYKNITMALPYWDYTKHKVTSEGADRYLIPAAFRNPNSSLYQEIRTSGLNETDDGKANGIKKFVINFDVEEHRNLSFLEFNSRIEMQPHNVIHCAVGYECASGMMGLTETAGQDPLFYSHHMNIERLFQEWLDLKFQDNNGGHPTQNLAWAKEVLKLDEELLNRQYYFVNETGDKVLTYTLADAFDQNKFPRRHYASSSSGSFTLASPADTHRNESVMVKVTTTDIGTYPYQPNGKMDTSEQYVAITLNHRSSTSFEVVLTKKDQASNKVVIGVISAFGVRVEDVVEDAVKSPANSNLKTHHDAHGHSHAHAHAHEPCTWESDPAKFDGHVPGKEIKFKLPEGSFLKDYDTIKIQRVSLTHDVHYPEDQPTVGLPLIESIELKY